MMNDEEIHHRDIVAILTDLHNDTNDLYKRCSGDGASARSVRSDVEKLITRADRDLRLKTQIVVRSRLEKSHAIPISLMTPRVAHLDPEDSIRLPDPEADATPRASSRRTMTSRVVPRRSPSRANPSTPRHFATPAVSSPASGAASSRAPMTNRTSPSVGSASALESPKRGERRIAKVSFGRDKIERPRTQMSRVRKRPKSNYKPSIELPDKHDPAAPPPPIAPSAIPKFGLLQLTETRIVDSQEAQRQLSDILVVCKARRDTQRPQGHLHAVQSWIMAPSDFVKDEKNDNKASGAGSPKKDDVKDAGEGNLEYAFPLRCGRPVESSPEFMKFQREFRNVWEPIEIVLGIMYTICEEHGAKHAVVDGQVILECSKREPDDITRERVMRAFVRSRMEPLKKTKYGFGFTGEGGEHRAAMLLQSTWRIYAARRALRLAVRAGFASRTIQRNWRARKRHLAMQKIIEAEMHRKELTFIALQQEISLFRPDRPHTILHLCTSPGGFEVGCLSALRNPAASLVIYSRYAFPQSVHDIINGCDGAESRVHVVVVSLKLPPSVDIETCLAADAVGLGSIFGMAGGNPCYVVPRFAHSALIDIAIRLKAIMLVPTQSKDQMYCSRDSVRRLMDGSGIRIFDGSSEVFDYHSLSDELAGSMLLRAQVRRQMLRCNDGQIGWVNIEDLKILNDLRMNGELLTDDELEDPQFIALVCRQVRENLSNLVRTVRGRSPEEFLATFAVSGGTVEAAPDQSVSHTCVAFFVPPVGASRIVGSWDTIFLSLYEPFASIHPAFTVSRDQLRASTLKIAATCSTQRLLGTSVVKYFYSAIRKGMDVANTNPLEMKLIASDLDIGRVGEYAAQGLATTFTATAFDDESMSMGPGVYTYVQKVLQLPAPIEHTDLIDRLHSENLPTGKMFFIPNLNDDSIYTMVVVAESPERLITLVYRILVTLVENVFRLNDEQDAELYRYCAAIEFLKNQFEMYENLTNTIYGA